MAWHQASLLLGRVLLPYLVATFSSRGIPNHSQCAFSYLCKVVLAPELSSRFWIPSRSFITAPLLFPWTSRTDRLKADPPSPLPPSRLHLFPHPHSGSSHSASSTHHLSRCTARVRTVADTPASLTMENFHSLPQTVTRYSGEACCTDVSTSSYLILQKKKKICQFSSGSGLRWEKERRQRMEKKKWRKERKEGRGEEKDRRSHGFGFLLFSLYVISANFL